MPGASLLYLKYTVTGNSCQIRSQASVLFSLFSRKQPFLTNGGRDGNIRYMNASSSSLGNPGVILFVGAAAMQRPEADYSPLFDEMERHGINEITTLTETDALTLEAALSTPGIGLCIVTGYLFLDREIAVIFARAVEGGLRLLVLDTVLENKTLAERLHISNIKHKVRIEKMEFSNWDAVKCRLLRAILDDEFRRLKNAPD